MPKIDVGLHVIGMSGKTWMKIGRFHDAQKAAEEMEQWMKSPGLTMALGWQLKIDGKEYATDDVGLSRSEYESHIKYCLDLHEAFFESVDKGPDEC